jgi:hypothetical protein
MASPSHIGRSIATPCKTGIPRWRCPRCIVIPVTRYAAPGQYPSDIANPHPKAFTLTYYSDLLLVIEQHDLLACRRRLTLPAADLVALCHAMLAIAPDEWIVAQLLARIEECLGAGMQAGPDAPANRISRPPAIPVRRRAARPASAR